MLDTIRVREVYDLYNRSASSAYSTFLEHKGTNTDYDSGEDVYDLRMNLCSELSRLPRNSVVWDGGCGTGLAIDALQQCEGYKHLSFLGIDFLTTLESIDVPGKSTLIVNGLLEDLNGEVMKKAKELDRFPPSLIIFSNSLYKPQELKTLDMVLNGTYRCLTPGGSSLIYSDNGMKGLDGTSPLYEDVIKVCTGSKVQFQIQLLENKSEVCGQYLKLTKCI